MRPSIGRPNCHRSRIDRRSMTPPSHRRWFRFSLRTVLVLLTLFCVWLGVQVKWIRDRHDVLARYPKTSDSACPSAPWSITSGGYLL